MKPLKLSVLAGVAIVLLLLCGCGGSGGGNIEHSDKTIVSVGSLDTRNTSYKAGETINTTGNELFVFFSDGTSDWISCGFNHVWAENYNDGVWLPIKHGDPLPIPPNPLPHGFPANFYIAGEYNGMIGPFITCTVRR
jgi:hypothetical protein